MKPEKYGHEAELARLLSGEIVAHSRVKKRPFPIALSAPVLKIATFHPNSLAALACALPALVALRESFPAATIHAYARAQLLPILQNFGALDEAHARPAGRGVPAQAALMARLLSQDYDIALSFSQSSNALLLAWATHAPIRAGFGPSRLESFLTHRVEKSGALSEFTALELARVVGAAPRGGKPREFLHYPPETRAKIEKLLENAGFEGGNFVVLAPQTAPLVRARTLPVENLWAEEIPHLRDCWPLVVCGPRRLECPSTNACLPFLNLSGRLDGIALAFLIECARGILGDESGALELARALEKPRVITPPTTALQNARPVFGL